MSEKFNPIEENHLPEIKEDFGKESEKMIQSFFDSLPGVIDTEKATYKEDVLGEVKKSKKQPKVDTWVEIGKNKEDSKVIGIQCTISDSEEVLRRKENEKKYCDIRYAYKEERPNAKIKTNQPCTVILLEMDKRVMGEISKECLGLNEEEKKALIFAEFLRLGVPQSFIGKLDGIEKRTLSEIFLNN